jgi:hypothetical protein
MHSLLRNVNDKGLTVNVSKCAVLVTGMRRLGGTVQYGNMVQRRGVLFLGHVDEQDYEYVVHFPAHVWQYAGCLAASSASSH